MGIFSPISFGVWRAAAFEADALPEKLDGSAKHFGNLASAKAVASYRTPKVLVVRFATSEQSQRR